ncbi:Tn3 family transposase (plasmid) [Escherichia coli]
MRKRYTDGQEDQLGALGLVTNAVVLWNTHLYAGSAGSSRARRVKH